MSVDAVVEGFAAAAVVADVAVLSSAGGGAEPDDWLCSAANRLCMNAVTASLDEVSVDAVPLVDDADVLDVVPSSETPRLANALLIADAKRPMPSVDDVLVVELLEVLNAKGSVDVEIPLKSDVDRLELLIAEMDMEFPSGRGATRA